MSDFSVFHAVLFLGGFWIVWRIFRRMVKNRHPNLTVKVVTPDDK